MMVCGSSNATIPVYIPHLWVEMAQWRERNLMMHDVIHDDRGREVEQNTPSWTYLKKAVGATRRVMKVKVARDGEPRQPRMKNQQQKMGRKVTGQAWANDSDIQR